MPTDKDDSKSKLNLYIAVQLLRTFFTTRQKAEAIIEKWAVENGESKAAVIEKLKSAGFDINTLPALFLIFV